MFNYSIFSELPAFLPPLIGWLFTLVLLFLFAFLTSLFVKKRSTFTGVMFLLLLGALAHFLLTLDTGEGLFSQTILEIGKEFNIGKSIYNVLAILELPVYILNTTFVEFITNAFMLEIDSEMANFFINPIYILVVHLVLFVLSFVLFKRQKKSQRIYSDYLS